MKTKITIGLAILVGIIGIFAFFIFFYPDESLQDHSDLTPSIQNTAKENNAYYLIEEARKAYVKPQHDAPEAISFLMGQATISKPNNSRNLTNEDINQFLSLEDSSIKLLEQAEQLTNYKNPKEDSYQTLNFVSILPSLNPSTMSLIRVLFVKGLNELKHGQSDEGLQTITQAMELASKMRRSSLSVIEYLINHSIIGQGKDIINYFRNNGVTIPAEIEAQINGLKDNDWQDYINALKFEFQAEKNQFDEIIKEAEGHPFSNNHFNIRRYATINSLAIHMRNLIDETKNFNCTKIAAKPSQSSGEPWTYLFKENGIGQVYILSVTLENSSKLFCDNSLVKNAESPVVDATTEKKIKRNANSQSPVVPDFSSTQPQE